MPTLQLHHDVPGRSQVRALACKDVLTFAADTRPAAPKKAADHFVGPSCPARQGRIPPAVPALASSPRLIDKLGLLAALASVCVGGIITCLVFLRQNWNGVMGMVQSIRQKISAGPVSPSSRNLGSQAPETSHASQAHTDSTVAKFVSAQPHPAAHQAGQRPVWCSDAAPVRWSEKAIFSTSRANLQTLIDMVHLKLSSAVMVTLANDFGTIFFDKTATAQQKTGLLRQTSATQQSVLEPVAAFLNACMSWRGNRNQPLPPEADRMISRLDLFLQQCEQGRNKSPAAALPQQRAASYRDLPSASVPIPKAIQEQLLELSARNSRRVEANGLLFNQIIGAMRILRKPSL